MGQYNCGVVTDTKMSTSWKYVRATSRIMFWVNSNIVEEIVKLG